MAIRRHMRSVLPTYLFLFFVFIVFLLRCSSSFPLCTNSRAPITLTAPLAFCSYNGSSCCNATDDSELQKEYISMNISDSACGSVVKLILCTKCNPYSANLLTVDTKAASSKLEDKWKSSTDFCNTFGAESICFNGESISFKNSVDLSPPHGICFEKIGNGSYLSMSPHPDGSKRVFLSNQAGMIWLATVPDQESGETLELDESNPFLDLTDTVYLDGDFGVMGLAFHPNFTSNGRFFVSFNCDRVQISSCSGRCSCNSEVKCDPLKIGLDDGTQPCRYQSVISEFTVNSSTTRPSEAKSAMPSEVRRIFTMGLPYTGHHAGQILFGPEDGYLYFMMGDGGNKGDPFNFAQNKKSLLGKIMRLDVDQMPSSGEVNDVDLWGNYSIPKGNPSADDSELQPEIWALGLRNPWRCSFDSKHPSYFFCADVGEEVYEEVNLISKGGNYGWRVYEGYNIFHPSSTAGGNTSVNSINPIFPVMGYYHSSINNKVGSASIAGGYVYRSDTDPCLNGRFVYADLFGEAMWAGMETPEDSGIYNSTKLLFACAKDTPMACEAVEGSPLPSLGIVYSFAQDNEDDIYVLASKGVFRVVRPSRCSYACASEKIGNANSRSPPPGSSSSTTGLMRIRLKPIILLASFVIWFTYF